MERGFYKLNEGNLLFATTVSSMGYTLLLEEKDSYDLPIDGWYYFKNETNARNYFRIN